MDKKIVPAKYSEEFRKTVVGQRQAGRTYVEIQKEYGISATTLSNWIRKYTPACMETAESLTERQIKELRRRNMELEEENLILKKAIAIFTRHSDRG